MEFFLTEVLKNSRLAFNTREATKEQLFSQGTEIFYEYKKTWKQFNIDLKINFFYQLYFFKFKF